MTQHDDDVSVRVDDCCCEFADLEVYSICSKTESVSDNNEVTLNYDEESLQEIYEQSSISNEYSYDEFKQRFVQEAQIAASVAWPSVKQVNNSWLESPNAQRITQVRLCVPVIFVRIYVCWKP